MPKIACLVLVTLLFVHAIWGSPIRPLTSKDRAHSVDSLIQKSSNSFETLSLGRSYDSEEDEDVTPPGSPPGSPNMHCRLRVVSGVSCMKIRDDETLIPGKIQNRIYHRANYTIILDKNSTIALALRTDHVFGTGNCGRVYLAQSIGMTPSRPVEVRYAIVKESLISSDEKQARIKEVMTPTVQKLLRVKKLSEYEFIADEEEREINILRHLDLLVGEPVFQNDGMRLVPVKLARGIQLDLFLKSTDPRQQLSILELESFLEKIISEAFPPVHAKRVVHGDCHLGNILYDSSSHTAELIDFGRSKLIKTTDEFQVPSALESFFNLYFERNPEKLAEDIFIVRTEFARFLFESGYPKNVTDHFVKAAEKYRLEHGLVVFE